MEEFQVKIKTPLREEGLENAESSAISFAEIPTASALEHKLAGPTQTYFGEESNEEVNWDDNF